MTHRQFMAWMEWLAEQWNVPSRSDAYQMQVACEVRRVLSRSPRSIQPKHFLLKFGDETETAAPVSQEASMAASKAAALSRMTMPIKHRIVDKDGNLIREEIIDNGKRRRS